MYACFEGWFRVDLENSTLPTFFLYTSWKWERKEIEEKLKNAFKWSTWLVVPFDSRLLRHNDDNVFDQLTVLVSAKKVEKLLGIPKIPYGSSFEMRSSIVELFTE